ncbi:uncharacterized protein LOC135221979 [Macrobrachium nipponense]|uniref:uncharacterized protein LOC135221979 n=1 Tax=Macrobrachium nipponense TaxID=159736 RepID=UPI0030C89DB5
MKIGNPLDVILALLVTFTLPSCKAIFEHIQVGIHMGTKRTKLPYCMAPELQLTYNLFVDYFDTNGPCLKPDGTQVHTFWNNHQPHDSDNFATFSAICIKLPKICHLLRRQRSERSFTDVGQQVVDSMKNNMHYLYSLLTGKDSSMPHDQVLTSRFGTVEPADKANYIDCKHKSCVQHGIGLCETIEDVAFPVVGRSAITNASVTILQDYPERVQPIFFRKCKVYKSQVVYGHCLQEYLPVSVYVSSYDTEVLSQDFVMVESGCRVIADITLPEYNPKVKGFLGSPVPTYVGTGWERHANETWLSSNHSQVGLEPALSAEELPARNQTGPLPGLGMRRISDRRLF